jgi:hypothetical protein
MPGRLIGLELRKVSYRGREISLGRHAFRMAKGSFPLVYLSDVITKIINGHPVAGIDGLLPWAYAEPPLKAVA